MKKNQSAGTGVTAPQGFRASAVSAGIRKRPGLDLALVVSETPALAAGMFTTNQMAAAPVLVSRDHLRNSRTHRAVLLNAGGANACTGIPGLRDARALCRNLARELGGRPEEVLIASTGVIGTRLPVGRMNAALRPAVAGLDARNGLDAARAILTTDTGPKLAEASFRWQGKKITLGGMAKGAGMIHPRMATMLVVITTDAGLERTELRNALREACRGTFNAISVDGQTSTNDTVFLLANGRAARLAGAGGRKIFVRALTEVTDQLARQVVLDGEGASKFLEIQVTGARSGAQAELAARAVGDSLLVKTAAHGEDANWGRILSALGATSIGLKPERIQVLANGVPLVKRGVDAGTDWRRANRALSGREIRVAIALGIGKGQARYRTCDLTAKYIEINAGYRS